jgi:glycosyltransferase involved in cell wall biosynthesis
VRYLRVPRNTGTPAAARNLGARAARGEWLAFLDDDDAWLPGKLAAQLDVAEAHDVIGTNATLTDGAPYLAELPAVRRCTRRDVLAANPLICSTVIARRALVLDAGGFPEARWLSGIEDYALWLEMADRGARIAVLAAPLAVYTSDPADRLSTGRHIASALARLALTRAVRRPLDLRLWRTAGNYGLAMLRPQNAGR